MIARPVESLLSVCLGPVISHFDGLIIFTGPDPKWVGDVSPLVHPPRWFTLQLYEWKHDYADARNALIGRAESLGYDWMMTLDADESMLPDDLITLRKYVELGACDNIIVPRYEFVDDFDHYCPWFYPDWHARVFKLNAGYHYVGKVHETLVRGPSQVHAKDVPNSVKAAMCPVFHYGKSKPSSDVWLKHNTYDRLAGGLAPLNELPPGTALPESWSLGYGKVRFLGNKPL